MGRRPLRMSPTRAPACARCPSLLVPFAFVGRLWSGFRPRERDGPVVPEGPSKGLAVAAIALAGGRIALDIADSHVVDSGVARVIGVVHSTHGQELYSGGF